MRQSTTRLLALLLFLLVGAARVHADEVDKRLIQARQLFYLNRYDQALQLVESVVPHNEHQWTQREQILLDIYRGQKNYAALEEVIRTALDRDPARPDRRDWLMLRAELYLKADRADSARRILDSIWRADPSDSTVNQVAALYEQNTLADLSRNTYLAARAESGDSTRFAYELALLFEARRDYAQATAEYFKAMAHDSASAAAVENRLMQLVNLKDGVAEMEGELTAAATVPATAQPANKLLSILYLETGRADLASRAAWSADSLANGKGFGVVLFMRMASERGYYKAAAEAGERLIAMYPDSPVRFQAEWEMANLTKRTGDYQKAATQYAALARQTPSARFRVEAALACADLLRSQLNQLHTADSVYREILHTQRMGNYFGRAMLGRALIAEQDGNFDSAHALLLALAAKEPQGPVREEMTYRLAELSYFDGKLDAALDAFNALAADYPKSVWANDALRHALFLTMYRKAAEADVRAMAKAEGLSRMGLYDSALTRIAVIRVGPEAPLAATATLLAADIYLAAGRTDSALAIWDDFAAKYPDHSEAAYALKRGAELCDEQLGRPEAALTRYRKLIEQYPQSHYAELARRRVRALGQL